MNALYPFSKSMLLIKRKIVVLGIIITFAAKVFSCGGGVVPYVPTQSGAGGGSTGKFFLLEKGVAVDMFDVKKLQPLFRNIVLSGNERKRRKSGQKLTKKDAESGQKQDQTDKTAISTNKTGSSKEPIPVLNVHRLH